MSVANLGDDCEMSHHPVKTITADPEQRMWRKKKVRAEEKREGRKKIGKREQSTDRRLLMMSSKLSTSKLEWTTFTKLPLRYTNSLESPTGRCTTVI